MTADGTAGAGQALFAFVRYWSRRWNASTGDPHTENGRYVLAVETVHALAGHDEVSVNDVAGELHLDQSNASRLIAQTVDAGYLARTRSAADSRRRTITVTDAGVELLAYAHRWQDDTFAHLTDDWSDQERREFGRAMRRLLARSAEIG
jgi:DNA-binding MarR family transcriptional regulator